MKIANNLLLFLLSMSCIHGYAAMGPKEVVEKIFATASSDKIIKDKNVQSEIERHVDFSTMSHNVLAKYNAKLSPTNFQWFDTTLKEIITRTVYPEAPEFLKNVKIQFKAINENSNTAKVVSEVHKKADITEVDYFLKMNDGNWQVVDIAIDGESWVENIREQVQNTLQKKQWAGLKQALEKRLVQLKKKV